MTIKYVQTKLKFVFILLQFIYKVCLSYLVEIDEISRENISHVIDVVNFPGNAVMS